MAAAEIQKKNHQISVLVVDDSVVFRRFLRDIFESSDDVVLCGEAKNGIDALNVMLKANPDVVMMDMEMPLMDGMTALQHFMIHCPVPTIMFSSITSEGTPRAFDALKNGAVDFLCKDFIFLEQDVDTQREKVLQKVRRAATIRVQQVEPALEQGAKPDRDVAGIMRVVFCEECGFRNTIDIHASFHEVCTQCGDPLIFQDKHSYQQESFVTVLGGGEGSIRNLLNIIPKLDPDGVGSVIVVIHADEEQVDAFTEYLDAVSPIKVLRIHEGMGLEKKCCYIASATDYICLRPQADQFTIQKVRSADSEVGSVDLAMASVASIFKENTGGVLLSGRELDGLRGIATVVKNGGTALVLNPADCLSKELVQKTIEKTDTGVVASEVELVRKINVMHRKGEG